MGTSHWKVSLIFYYKNHVMCNYKVVQFDTTSTSCMALLKQAILATLSSLLAKVYLKHHGAMKKHRISANLYSLLNMTAQLISGRYIVIFCVGPWIIVYAHTHLQTKRLQSFGIEYFGVGIDLMGKRGPTITGTPNGVGFMMNNHQMILPQFKAYTGINLV